MSDFVYSHADFEAPLPLPIPEIVDPRTIGGEARFKAVSTMTDTATLRVTYSTVEPEAKRALRKAKAQLLKPDNGFKTASDMTNNQTLKPDVGEKFRELAAKLIEEFPLISVDEGIFGGVPHIKGIRFSVADVLAQVAILGDTETVAEEFSVTTEQIEDALAYARSFISIACDPHEVHA